MSRINQCFAALKAKDKKALIPYVTAGDPQPAVTVPLMHAMVEAGADIIELGVPFSDPMADGPVIQLACERALSHGTRLLDVLSMVKTFREKDDITPVVLMGYLNPIEVLGYESFAAQAKAAGVDGVLTVDLPPEESAEFVEAMKQNALDVIYLLAPTTQESRIEQVCEYGSGYVYYVSVKGVTGSAALDVSEVASKLEVVRRHTDMPVGVGFGIRDGASAAAVANVADGVIVGSVLVNAIAEKVNQPEQISKDVAGIIAQMRGAMDA
ncbi:tryptophan synthase subunit alpha [Neptunomonas concharum]|uniref:Tryptophan synthase alpha chain n=1 Tax=Neptunomonas concharum TaxID=1031538 RepID=A0A5P1RCH2_9GAMM|nr:tryptophan synthase subunit alpha [Neptunomonas concharum]QEQ96966.1 tryptophan synthase subunit alpha [Neptunomonas concharum]